MGKVNLLKVFIIIVVVALAIGLLYKLFSGNSKGEKYETEAENVEEEYSVKGADGTEYKTYQQACRANDFEAAHEFIDLIYNELAKVIEETNPSGANAYNTSLQYEKQFYSAEDYVFKQEMMYLMSNGDEMSSDKILYLLTELQVLGEPLNEGINDMFDAESLPQRLYSQYIKRFNSHCDQILDLAISQNNEYLAKKVLGMYKKNINIFMGGSDIQAPDGSWAKKAPDGTYVDGSHCYVKYLDSDKESAEKKYKKKWK